MRRVTVENEMLVRCVGVHADHGGIEATLRVRHETAKEAAHGLDLIRAHLPAYVLRSRGFALMMHRHLHTVAQVGESIEKPVRCIFPNVNRAVFGLKSVRSRTRLE